MLILLALPFLAMGADKGGGTFYLQLIRGTDDAKPPAPEARLAGLKVSRRLQMFKWTHYWEVARRKVVIEPGGKTRQRMSPQREVEISFSAPREMTVCIYADGKLARRRKQSQDTPFYIAGGDKDGNQSWFIVVRRDKPPGEMANLN